MMDTFPTADSVKYLKERVHEFNMARGWARFHTPKNIATALSVEAAELLRTFQWQVDEEPRVALQEDHLDEVKKEVADVAMYLLTLCDVLQIDLGNEIEEKLTINATNYPEVEYCGPWKERRRDS